MTAAPVVTWVTLAALTISVLFAGSILLVSSGAYRTIATWASAGVAVSIYFDPAAPDGDIVALRSELSADPLVLDVAFVSQDEAWQLVAKSLADTPELMAGLDASILPPSLELVADPSLDGGELSARLDRWRGSAGVTDVQHNRFEAGRRSAALTLVGWLSRAIGLVALFTSMLIVGATFQLAVYSQREELDVLRLMGAVGRRYWGPVVLAGFIEGVLASLFAVALLYGAYAGVTLRLGSELPELTRALGFLTMPQMVGLVAWGALLGGTGSVLGIWRVAQWR